MRFLRKIVKCILIFSVIAGILTQVKNSDIGQKVNSAISGIGTSNIVDSVEQKGLSSSSSEDSSSSISAYSGTLISIPKYAGEDYIVLNNNIPDLDAVDGSKAFESYSKLDSLGRCGTAYACMCKETFATQDRADISGIYPTGWNQEKYTIDGEDVYVYNRSHLLPFHGCGSDAYYDINNSNLNLITGTEYMNQEVMTQFENMVEDYIEETGNHVLYRVTPYFEGSDLVATGVEMEALSVEDNGESIEYDVFVYNVEPDVDIDYATGVTSMSLDEAA